MILRKARYLPPQKGVQPTSRGLYLLFSIVEASSTKMRIYIFVLIYALQLVMTFPTFKATCRTETPVQTYTLYFVHHLFDVFLFWAPLFILRKPEAIAHVAAVVLVGAHWFSYDNKCIATVIMNEQCGYNRSLWLDSLKNRMGLRAWNEYFHFIWLGAALLYDAYLLYM